MTVTQGMRPGTGRERAIVQAYLAGLPLKQIGHSETVRRALTRAGVTERRRSASPAWWAEAAELRRSGVAIAAIARQLDMERRPVQYALTRMGLR